MTQSGHSDVSLGEVIRRLEVMQATIDRQEARYVSRQELALTLVPIINTQSAHGSDIDELQQGEKDRVKSDRDWRRQITLVVLAFALASLGSLAVGITQLLA